MALSDPSDGDHRRLAYKPALDGIRALAVAAVLAYHAGLPWAKGGFLGVDAFFVLSGYLITSILLSEWNASGRIGLLAFWTRRARRLLPALFLMLVGVAFYAVAFADRIEIAKIRADALATIGYVANWRQVFAGQSYFDAFTLPSPLRHTWSLAIEEQYYLCWPLLLLFLLQLARLSRRRLLLATLVMAAASALLMATLFRPEHDPSRVYYGTDTRAQSLLVGAALAMLLMQLGPLRDRFLTWMLQVAAVECAIGIGWVWIHASGSDTFLYRGGFLLLAGGIAVIITAAVQPSPGVVGRVLSLPPLRGLGLISYGVYLWHWPVYLMLTPGRTGLTGWDGHELFIVRVLVTVAVATASYHLLEMPIRRGAFRYRKIAWTFAPSGAVALAVVLVLVTRSTVSPAVESASLERSGRTARLAPQTSEVLASVAPLRVMLVGDSEGRSMLPGLKFLAEQNNLVIKDVVGTGCGFLDLDEAPDPNNPGPATPLSEEVAGICHGWHTTWPDEVTAFRPDVVLFVFGPWDSYTLGVNGQLLQAGSPEWHDYFMKGLQKELDLFTADGARLVLLTYPFYRPPLWSSLPNADELEHDAWQRITNVNDVYRQFAELRPDKVSLVGLNRFVCPEGKFTDLSIDGVRLREDGGHFTEGGAIEVARWLVPRIEEVESGGAPLASAP